MRSRGDLAGEDAISICEDLYLGELKFVVLGVDGVVMVVVEEHYVVVVLKAVSPVAHLIHLINSEESYY